MIGSLQEAHKPAPGSTRIASRTTPDNAPRDAAGSAAAQSDFFEQPVPRRFVHRASVAEVLLTGFAADRRPDTFLLAAQWPRGHGYYVTSRGVHDPLLFAETIRQTGLMIGHTGYDVPLENPYVMHRLSYEISPAGLACEGVPTNLILAVECSELRFCKDQLRGFRFDVELRRDSRIVGTGSCATACMTPAAYRRLRGGAGAVSLPTDPLVLPEPVSPALVGKDTRADVVLSPTDADDTWLLRCDAAHPVLFDHPVDHAPGMVLIEAMRQSAHCLLYPQRTAMVRLEANFERYAELNEPTVVHAALEGTEPDGSARVRVELTQSGRPVAGGRCVCRAVA